MTAFLRNVQRCRQSDRRTRESACRTRRPQMPNHAATHGVTPARRRAVIRRACSQMSLSSVTEPSADGTRLWSETQWHSSARRDRHSGVRWQSAAAVVFAGSREAHHQELPGSTKQSFFGGRAHMAAARPKAVKIGSAQAGPRRAEVRWRNDVVQWP